MSRQAVLEKAKNTKVIPAPVAALSEREAAAYIGMSVFYLQRDRSEGARNGRTLGPPFVKIGKRIVYLVNDLDSWLAHKRVARGDEH